MAKQKVKTKDNEANRVIFNIRPGPASEQQQKLWRLFWQKLLCQVKGNECENPP